MKRILIASLSSFLFLNSFIFSQDEIALIIGDRDITLGEFERLYKKNSSSLAYEQQDLEDYLERFINFKLKVIEAENLGNDTTGTFINELTTYRKELAKPYMIDSVYLEKLLLNDYKKLSAEINASHILIKLDQRSTPSDTLAAWDKIINLRERALKGEDFNKLAEQYSDDPSAEHNKGNLGWFTIQRMMPEFENMAYATPSGEISMPVKTNYGYHIIKVHDYRPARGFILISNIYFRIPHESGEEEAKAAKEKAFDVYKSLQEGEDFEEMARLHSDDRASASNGGRMDWFTSGVMIPDFENQAFALETPGQITEPFKTMFGWHIIQLIDRKPIGTLDEEKEKLLTRIHAGPSNILLKNAFIKKLKNKYNYSENREVIDEFHTYLDSSVYNGQWSASSIPDPHRVVIKIGDKKALAKDFGRYLEVNQRFVAGLNIKAFVNDRFRRFSDEFITNYEESLLASKYPEYKNILQEYHDGILLFDLTDKMVWSRAVEDTAGLEQFFKKNREHYKWDISRAEAYIVKLNDSTLVSRARKVTSKEAGKKRFSKELLAGKLCPEDTTGSCLELVYGKYEKGNSEIVDNTGWKKGLGQNVYEEGKVSFVYINKVLPPGPKELDEARGIIISDYQDYLEKEWIKELRKKYPVVINRDVIAKVK